MQVISFKYFYALNAFVEYDRVETNLAIIWRDVAGTPVFSFNKAKEKWRNLESSQELHPDVLPDVEEQYQLSQHTPKATQMTLYRHSGHNYVREENADSIKWMDSEDNYRYTYNKKDGYWVEVGAIGSDVDVECFLEKRYQEFVKPTQPPTPPQLRLVSRGQSTSTGKEVIELHAYNQPRGVWEKLPIDASIVSGCFLDLEEILNRYV